MKNLKKLISIFITGFVMLNCIAAASRSNNMDVLNGKEGVFAVIELGSRERSSPAAAEPGREGNPAQQDDVRAVEQREGARDAGKGALRPSRQPFARRADQRP